jgi:hypothetical protein
VEGHLTWEISPILLLINDTCHNLVRGHHQPRVSSEILIRKGETRAEVQEMTVTAAAAPGQVTRQPRNRSSEPPELYIQQQPARGKALDDLRSKRRAEARVTILLSVRNQRGKADPMSTRSKHLSTQST